MIKLIRDKETGDYYTKDKKWKIEKGYTGWNASELDERLTVLCNTEIYKYVFSCETLKEIRESL